MAKKADKTKSSTLKHSGGSEEALFLLERLCGSFALRFSRANATQTLTPYDGEFQLRWFEKAAEKLGIKTHIEHIKPSKVPALNYPFIMLFKDGSAGLALKKYADAGKIEYLTFGTDAKTVTLATIDRNCVNQVVLTAPLQSKKLGQSRETKAHWLWGPIRAFWSSWAYMALAALVINLIGLAMPLFVMNVYDRVVPYNSISTLWALFVGVVLALFIDFGLRIFRALFISNTSRRIDMGISSNLFEQAMDIKLAERNVKTGELSSQIREFDSVRDFFTSSGLVSIIDLLFVGIFLFALWVIVGPLALVPLFAVPVVLIATLLLQIPLSRAVNKSQTAHLNRNSVLVESLANIETVKAISAEGVLQKRWENAVASSVRAGSSIGFWSSLAMFFSLLVQQAVGVLVITWGVFLVADGDITIGALIASNILAGRVLAPISGIATTLVRLQQSITAYGFLDRFMRLERDNHQDKSAGTSIGNSVGRIEFRALDFCYPGQTKNALSDLSFTITPGERIAILGRVGSGKSSIGKLLCGLYDPTNGAIILDDVDIRHQSKAELRQKIGYVSQEPELFSGTMVENITLTNSDQTKLEQAASISGVTAIAQNHPSGFEMQVGERGKELSGGQRQAVALARAMMSDYKILFLDEPTGQMDTASEAAFLHAFSNWLKPEQTLILSTHRNAVLSLVSRIIIVENGQIIADGPKDKVLEKMKATGFVRQGGNA